VVFVDGARDRRNLDLVSDLRALSYRVAGLSRDATDGQEEAFTELEKVTADMQAGWSQLKENGSELPAETLESYEKALSSIKQQTDVIVGDKETIIFLHQVVDTLNERLPQLQVAHDQIVDTLLDARAP